MALFRQSKKSKDGKKVQGKTWWYEFRFGGQKIRESAKTRSKTLAQRAEQKRRAELEEGYHGLKKRQGPKLFMVAAEEWLELKKPTLAPKSYIIEETNLRLHLLPVFGPKLISDIASDAKNVADYQKQRLVEGAAPKTVNLEVGTLRAILRRYRMWASVQPDVTMCAVEDNLGRAITPDEQAKLLKACAGRRSRSLPVGVTVGLNTGMRLGEVRHLRWSHLDFIRETVTVGKSKTAAGKGRVIPMTQPLLECLVAWALNFPDRKPEHYVFPSERYGASGDDLVPCAYDTDPTKPIGSWKNGWTAARREAKVQCRFHDFRHTAATRMLEAQPPIPFQVVVDIMGWSPATAIRMAKRYGHIGQEARRNAVNAIARAAEKRMLESDPPQVQVQPKLKRGPADSPSTLEVDTTHDAVN